MATNVGINCADLTKSRKNREKIAKKSRKKCEKMRKNERRCEFPVMGSFGQAGKKCAKFFHVPKKSETKGKKCALMGKNRKKCAKNAQKCAKMRYFEKMEKMRKKCAKMWKNAQRISPPPLPWLGSRCSKSLPHPIASASTSPC